MSDFRGMSPNQINAVRFAEDLYNIRPRQQPELPLVVNSDLARGQYEHMVNVPHPVETGIVLGAEPNSDETVFTDPRIPQEDFTLGCRGVNDFKQQYGLFGNYDRQIHNTINEGNQRGDNIGLYTTPIHRIFGAVTAEPNFWDDSLASNSKLYMPDYN
jgi:hypothetical protein